MSKSEKNKEGQAGDEETACREKARKLTEKADKLREAKILKAGKLAKAFLDTGFKDFETFKTDLAEIFPK